MFRGEHRAETFGFIDNITLRVSYDTPTKDNAVVVAVSQCGGTGRSFDWGQNKRNLNQVRAWSVQALAPRAGLAWNSKSPVGLVRCLLAGFSLLSLMNTINFDAFCGVCAA